MITITDMREDRSPMFLSRHECAGGNGARIDSGEDTRRAGGGERAGAYRRPPAGDDPRGCRAGASNAGERSHPEAGGRCDRGRG